jgi:hypothetical protein
MERGTLIRELTRLCKNCAVLVPSNPELPLDGVQLGLAADYLDQAKYFIPLGHPARNVISKHFPPESAYRESLSVYTLYSILNTVIVTLGGEGVDIP